MMFVLDDGASIGMLVLVRMLDVYNKKFFNFIFVFVFVLLSFLLFLTRVRDDQVLILVEEEVRGTEAGP